MSPETALNKQQPFAAPASHAPKKVLVMSSSLLIDRSILHTGFLPALLAQNAEVEIWAGSAHNLAYRELWRKQPATIRPLPALRPFREVLHNYPRRLNEALWDYRQEEPSRLSMLRHRPVPRSSVVAWLIDKLAPALARLNVQKFVDDILQKWLLMYERSPEATRLLTANRPDVVLTTGPFQFEQPALAASALRMGIKTVALIPSWDNISTKRRMVFRYDAYIVWSEKLRAELYERYPHTRKYPVYVVGAPQFDVFFDPRFSQTREEFCAGQQLDPAKPIIVYAVGSPNFLGGEPYGAIAMARAVDAGELGDVQLIVRPHPQHDHGRLGALFGGFSDRVHLQQTAVVGTPTSSRSQDESQIAEWVNTFRHAAVVVNLASTVTVDAALCDKPVVNLDFDPAPGAPDQELIQDINHKWTHFQPIAESDGVWLVQNVDEMLTAVRGYLANPKLHQAGRKWLTQYVCGYVDGQCGARLANALCDFVDKQRAQGADNDARDRMEEASRPQASL